MRKKWLEEKDASKKKVVTLLITFGLIYDIKPDTAKEFLNVSNEALTLIQTMDGHIQIILYADVTLARKPPNSFGYH